MIDEPARTCTRSDRDRANDRAHECGRECTAKRDREEQTEQETADENCDRWSEDDLRGAAGGRFFTPVTLAAIAAMTGLQAMA